ncbi:MAG: hypothetical protein R3D81_03465 [Thalassovita sp.]
MSYGRVLWILLKRGIRTATAAHFRVSVKFVNDMVKLKRETGTLALPQGRRGHGKLAGVHDWARRRIEGEA